jgi:hypothetical protein
LDDRIVYWLKLMSVKFTLHLMRNRQEWIKRMLNLTYTEKEKRNPLQESLKRGSGTTAAVTSGCSNLDLMGSEIKI